MQVSVVRSRWAILLLLDDRFSSHSCLELLQADPGLFQDALEGAAIDFSMHWHDASTIATAQDHMTAALPLENKSQPLQSTPRPPSLKRPAV
jgi:hypothetical protein